jgi:hypothetical protein
MPSRPVEPEDEAVVTESRGKIFNSLSIPKRPEPEAQPTPAEPVTTPSPRPADMPKRDPKPVDPMDEDDDGDWGAVPAFLRRSKLK